MDEARMRAFSGKIYADMAGAMAAGMAYLGTQTGLFESMAGKGPLKLDEVAAEAGLHSRYVEEWLKGMVCAGYIEYDPDAGSFLLPDEHAHLLASDGTDHFAGGLFGVVPFMLGAAPDVAEAFHNGGGVPYEAFGTEFTAALNKMNQGAYAHRFAGYWMGKMPEMKARLERGAQVLDVGCGQGSLIMAMATAFPRSQFTGLDLDARSIGEAAAMAQREGLDGRVRFVTQDVAELDGAAAYDLITACDCVHDFADPVATLLAMRARLKDDGILFVVEPKAADRLEENINPISTMFYGFSLFHCMTQSLAQGGPGLGTCMGPGNTAALMREAGFSSFEQLPIKSTTNLFYAVRP